MRIGYPCINRSIGCRSDRKFRLASYTEERFFSTVRNNISCLRQILEWNLMHGIRFFRISSDIIPFGSHPVCSFPWKKSFVDELVLIGNYISDSGIRISMHPDQFIILNSPDTKIVSRSIDELVYHADLLDLMGLDNTAKIQLHVGGLYGNPHESSALFIRVYDQLDPAIKSRLVVENDEQRFNAADCLNIHTYTGVPVRFDVFHHACKNNREGIRASLALILTVLAIFRNIDNHIRSWGILLVAYTTGITTLISLGLGGSGRLYLLSLPVIALILLGVRSGMFMSVVSIITE